MMKLSKRITTVFLLFSFFIIPCTLSSVDAQNLKTVDAVTQATSSGWSLSYQMMWGKNKYENLTVLRSFRDEVLSKSELGQAYVSLLYNNSIEIAFLLLRRPALRVQTREVLNAVTIELNEQSGNNEICISQSTIDDFESLLNSFESSASPRLKAAIEIVKEDIANGVINGQLGFTIGE
jgi:hypothetical protein